MYSPPAGQNGVSEDARQLASVLRQRLPQEQVGKAPRIEVIPRDILKVLLGTPALNVADIFPGTPAEGRALELCSLVGSGGTTDDDMRGWLVDSSLAPSLRAGVRFQLASRLASQARQRPQAIEEAISQWIKALDYYRPDATPREWAQATLELAQCYSMGAQAGREINLGEALRLIDSSLRVLVPDRYPEDFAGHVRQCGVIFECS